MKVLMCRRMVTHIWYVWYKRWLVVQERRNAKRLVKLVV